MNYDLITVLGPTAVGKTKLAAALANRFNGEIISADSRQVYKKMDIGTGKDLSDYIINGKQINYHLIDVVEPHDEFNLFSFVRAFQKVYEDIKKREKEIFLVGGTGLYLHSILKGYELNKVSFDERKMNELSKKSLDQLTVYLKNINPELHNTTDLLDKERVIKAIIVAEGSNESAGVRLNSFNIGVYEERSVIKKRITDRLKKRLEEGMIDEVKELMKNGITLDKLNFFGLEYKYVGNYLAGNLNYNDMFQKLNSAIHNFAKKQMTWFRKMEREGIEINWIKAGDIDTAKRVIEEKYYEQA